MNNQPGQTISLDDERVPAWITIVDWPGGRLETFDRVSATHDDHEHAGLLARYCTQMPGALRIIAVWESQADADGFFASLPAENKARLAPDGAPTRSSFPAHRAFYAHDDVQPTAAPSSTAR